jgi:uncharacterized protein (DUF58 family)
MVSGVDLDVDALLRLRHLAARMRDSRMPPRSLMPGDIVHRRRGRGLEVHDIRVWSEGDDLRHLDHNATARTGIPHTRTYLDERERTVLLIADFRPSMLFGTRRAFRSVAAAETLALLGWRAAGRGGRVGLAAASAGGMQYGRRGRGERAMIALTGTLAEAHRDALLDRSSDDPPLDTILETASMLPGSGSTIIVATALDTPGERFEAVAAGLSERHDLVFCLIEDEFERGAVPGTYPFTTAQGANGWLRVDSGAKRPALEARATALRRLGARVLRLPALNTPEANLPVLDQLDV